MNEKCVKQKTNNEASEAIYRKLNGEKAFLRCKYNQTTVVAAEDTRDTMTTPKIGTHTHTHNTIA